MGEEAFCRSGILSSGVFSAVLDLRQGMDVLGQAQPERFLLSNPKTFLPTDRYARKRVRMSQESLRETNLEATVTRFAFPWEIRRDLK